MNDITNETERTPEQVADLLDGAADWLETHAWTKNAYIRSEHVRTDDGLPVLKDNGLEYEMRPVSACAVGALRLAAGTRLDSSGASARPRATNPQGADVALYEAGTREMGRCVKEWGGVSAEYAAPDVSPEDVIPFWNDRQGQSGTKVIEMFRRCAQRVRAGRQVKSKGDSDA